MNLIQQYLKALIFAMISFHVAHADVSENLIQEAQNPVANLISLPFQNDTYFNNGPYNRTANVLNIEPVIPFSLNDNWNLITRTILPIETQPNLNSASGDTNGLGDLNPTLFLSPALSSKVIWGIGPTFSIPTATNNNLGSGKWGAGPSAVIVMMPGHWVFGTLIYNIWSFAGDSSRQNVNTGTLQYFINYNLPKGWYIVSSPILTANWLASSSQRWTIPVGGGFGRLIDIGKQPINLSLQSFYNIKTPTNGPEWSIRAQIQFLFPK